MLRLNQCHAIIALVVCNLSTAILADEIDRIGWFGDWSVFSDGGVCWVSSMMYMDGRDEVFEDRLVSVSFFDRSGIPEVSFFLGDREDQVESALVVIGGDSVKLYPDDHFFIPSVEWSDTLLRAVISDEPIQVHLEYSSGAMEIYEPSSRGFQDAYAYAWRACGLRRPQNLRSSP